MIANLRLQGRAQESSTCGLCEWPGDVNGVAFTLIYADAVAVTLDCSQKAAFSLHVGLNKTILMIVYKYFKSKISFVVVEVHICTRTSVKVLYLPEDRLENYLRVASRVYKKSLSKPSSSVAHVSPDVSIMNVCVLVRCCVDIGKQSSS